MRIIRLNKDYEAKYELFLQKSNHTMLYSSNQFRKLLKQVLNDEDYYLLAINDFDEILGCLPAFIRKGPNGPVLNSLPFYGSHGSLIEFNQDLNVRVGLLKAFYDLATEQACCSATLITPLFEKDVSFYDKYLQYNFKDCRIGQYTVLPAIKDQSPLEEEALMVNFHYKTRNMIRKAIKSGINIEIGYSKEKMRFLRDVHLENMTEINGPAKPDSFFESVPQFFQSGKDFEIYTAYYQGEPIAALLVFFFNRTVEYFTPVIKKEFRSLQPLSLIIIKAMKDAICRGFCYWNWGGTGKNQVGVYNFKKRWGTTETNYYYYTRIFDHRIVKQSKNSLLENYRYFYVVPFERLET